MHGLSVLDYSDTCFREELRRSDLDDKKIWRGAATATTFTRSKENWEAKSRALKTYKWRTISVRRLEGTLLNGKFCSWVCSTTSNGGEVAFGKMY